MPYDSAKRLSEKARSINRPAAKEVLPLPSPRGEGGSPPAAGGETDEVEKPNAGYAQCN